MDIKNFRIFQDQTIVFGEYITIFSGRNSTGKSTLLGMIANSGELKKADGVTYLKRPFRAEFGEIFKGSQQFDKQGSDRFTVVLNNAEGEEIDKRTFRTAWQATERARKAKKGIIVSSNGNVTQSSSLKNIEQLKAEKRFRVIPEKKSKEKKSEAKFKYPILYLGLSRLFPIGESKDVTVNQKGLVFLNDEHKE
ncbi:AAA family ATPase [uncultured Sutterella sp.]|uniref:AAA family ATPase n=1 Tax=uncultured Sutterella sp. TaxID=286133 RepID=UPI0026056852|nr:AAA family ATPase [uncultured Sutterella sp.]